MSNIDYILLKNSNFDKKVVINKFINLIDDILAQFKADGFFGSSCIHPKQIDVINEVFSTPSSELEEARQVVSALEGGKSVGVDRSGRMIDQASLKIAQRILRRSNSA